MTAYAPIQTYANNHTIAELAEPRISANVPRPFPPLGMGSWHKTSVYMEQLTTYTMFLNTYYVIGLSIMVSIIVIPSGKTIGSEV